MTDIKGLTNKAISKVALPSQFCSKAIFCRASFLLSVVCVLSSVLCLLSPAHAEEYSFDIKEIEKKPYHIGGFVELRPALSGLDKDSALYKLRFYNRNEGNTIEDYNAKLQLEGSLEKGIARFFIKQIMCWPIRRSMIATGAVSF